MRLGRIGSPIKRGRYLWALDDVLIIGCQLGLLLPKNWVLAATCSTFILAMNGPPWRIVHKIAPQEANTFDFDLNLLCHSLSTLLKRT